MNKKNINLNDLEWLTVYILVWFFRSIDNNYCCHIWRRSKKSSEFFFCDDVHCRHCVYCKWRTVSCVHWNRKEMMMQPWQPCAILLKRSIIWKLLYLIFLMYTPYEKTILSGVAFLVELSKQDNSLRVLIALNEQTNNLYRCMIVYYLYRRKWYVLQLTIINN